MAAGLLATRGVRLLVLTTSLLLLCVAVALNILAHKEQADTTASPVDIALVSAARPSTWPAVPAATDRIWKVSRAGRRIAHKVISRHRRTTPQDILGSTPIKSFSKR